MSIQSNTEFPFGSHTPVSDSDTTDDNQIGVIVPAMELYGNATRLTTRRFAKLFFSQNGSSSDIVVTAGTATLATVTPAGTTNDFVVTCDIWVDLFTGLARSITVVSDISVSPQTDVTTVVAFDSAETSGIGIDFVIDVAHSNMINTSSAKGGFVSGA